MRPTRRPVPLPLTRPATASLLSAALLAFAVGLEAQAAGPPPGTTAVGPVAARRDVLATQAQLDRIEAALVSHVARTKALPCPARGDLPLTDPRGGVAVPVVAERCDFGGSGAESGVVPWRTLGLAASDALDPWGRRIEYRVADRPGRSLVAPRGMDFSACMAEDAALPQRAPDPLAIDICGRVGRRLADALAGAGLDLDRPGGPMRAASGTGAAFFLASTGVNGRGGWTLSGGRLPAAESGPERRVGTAGMGGPALVVADWRPGDGAGAFDDIVRIRSVRELMNASGLWPRWAEPTSSSHYDMALKGTWVTAAAPAGVGDTSETGSLTYMGRNELGEIFFRARYKRAGGPATLRMEVLVAGTGDRFVIDLANGTEAILNVGEYPSWPTVFIRRVGGRNVGTATADLTPKPFDLGCYLDFGQFTCDDPGRGRNLGNEGSVVISRARGPSAGGLTYLGRDRDDDDALFAVTYNEAGGPPTRSFRVEGPNGLLRDLTLANGQQAVLNFGPLPAGGGVVTLRDAGGGVLGSARPA